MKVMLIGRGYPTSKYKMNGIFEFDQAKALAKAGADVVYLALDVRSIRRWRKWGVEKKTIDGVRVYAINIPCGKIPVIVRDKISVWALIHLYHIVVKAEGKPDIIHSHFIRIGKIAATVFGPEKNIRMVFTEHYSAMNQNQISKQYMDMGSITYPVMDRILVVSEHLKKNLNEKFGVTSQVVPNIFDLSQFDFRERDHITKGTNFSFVSVGRLHPDKRMDLLIEAFFIAFKDHPEVSLTIFGDGSERKPLEQLVTRLKMNQQVFFGGEVDRSVLADHISKSDAFVSTSRLETFGLALIEAMAMGLPVVTTNSGGPVDFMNESNGILVNSDVPAIIAQELQRMYQNIGSYDRREISNAVKTQYNPESIAATLLGIYNELLLNANSDSVKE